MNFKCYYVYIVTNSRKTVLYIGVTNNLPQRIIEHYLQRSKPFTFCGKYYCYWLVYYEEFRYISNAIAREKELKGFTRQKKNDLIGTHNLEWKFLNKEICEEGWPPQYPVAR